MRFRYSSYSMALAVGQVLLDDLASDVVLDSLGDGIPVALEATELRRDSVGDTDFHN